MEPQFDKYVLHALEDYQSVWGRKDATDEELIAAARKLLLFNYFFLFLNKPDWPHLTHIGGINKLDCLGIAKIAHRTRNLTDFQSIPDTNLRQELTNEINKQLNINFDTNKHLIVSLYRGEHLLDYSEYVVFELPIK